MAKPSLRRLVELAGKMGILVSIVIGLYYLYVLGRWVLTTLFYLRILYQEHGIKPNLLWGLGPAQNIFPMQFYRCWRRFKQRATSPTTPDTTRAASDNAPHEYLAIHEVGGPPLPRRNRAVSNVYPSLPAKSSSMYSNDPQALYAEPGSRTLPAGPPRETLYSIQDLRPTEGIAKRASLLLNAQTKATPPAADA